jgi:hypothetical protein
MAEHSGRCSRMIETQTPFRKVSGTFFRSVLSDRVDQVLEPPGPASAGRYHRLGEPTLYTSAAMEWSIMAIAGYMREAQRPRVVVPLSCNLAQQKPPLNSNNIFLAEPHLGSV